MKPFLAFNSTSSPSNGQFTENSLSPKISQKCPKIAIFLAENCKKNQFQSEYERFFWVDIFCSYPSNLVLNIFAKRMTTYGGFGVRDTAGLWSAVTTQFNRRLTASLLAVKLGSNRHHKPVISRTPLRVKWSFFLQKCWELNLRDSYKNFWPIKTLIFALELIFFAIFC